MRHLILISALLGLQWTALAEPEITGTASELTDYLRGLPKTVLVSGESEVRVPAQRAVLTLKVTTENRGLQEAMRANVQMRSRLADHLRGQGIPADRIQASKFSSTPRYGLFSDKARSYRVENVMRIAVQDEQEFQKAASAVDAWAEVQFEGVEFEYADREALKQRALSQACDNANERRKLYEDKLGLALVPVNFSEGIVSRRDLEADNYALRRYSSAGVSVEPVSASRPRDAADPALGESVSSFGELVYTARVAVEYAVQSK